MPEALTAADVSAVVNKHHSGYGLDGMGCGGGWIWIILLFVLFGGYGGYGNRQGLTQIELQQGFDTQNVLRKLDGITQGLCDGFYAQNTTMLTGFNTIGQEIANNRFAMQQCCCETNRNIDAVRYEAAKNTCDIVRAIEKDGDATRALINANTMQDLRDKLTAKDQVIQTKDFMLSQQAQNDFLVNALAPRSIPAYITCSPYQAANYYNNCGCGQFA